MISPTYGLYAKDLEGLLDGDVSSSNVDRERVARDTSIFYLKPEIVVYPKHKEDVSKVLEYVNLQKNKGRDVSIAIRSAGTCMTGGPLSQSIVVDMTRYMNRISELSVESATAEPGVYYRDFEFATLKKGWLMPSYPASRELAAIGGIVSNNSGGEKTLTYGKTEKYIKSIEVVYADGAKAKLSPLSGSSLILKMNEDTTDGRIHREMYNLITQNYDVIMRAKPSVSKNSSGYYLWNAYNKGKDILDLSKVIVGSQGTLACVTSATITGVKPKSHSRMLVMFVPSTTHLGEIIPRILTHKPETLESYDDHTFKIALRFFKDIAIRMGGNMFTLAWQFLPEFWMALSGGIPKIILMAEFTGDTEADVEKQVDKAYNDMKSFNLPIKKTYSAQESKKYWTFRRESFNLLRTKLSGYRTAPTIDDIIVHPKDLPVFLPELEKILSKYDLIYTVAGHMGNANFHIIPLINIHKKGIVETLHRLMDEVYALVLLYDGSISAEHNDGLLRTPYLSKMFSPEIISLFEQTKNIFDPQGILNPGKKVYGDKDFAWRHIDTK
jgi:FAD/FMN-containing dehydrogenase